MTMALDVVINIEGLGPSPQGTYLHELSLSPKGTNSLLFFNHLKGFLDAPLKTHINQNMAVKRILILSTLSLLE